MQTFTLDRDAGMVESLRFGGAVVANLAGPWSLRIQDSYATYLYDAVFKPFGPQKWQVEETLRETGHPFHRTRMGQTNYDCQAGLEGQKVVMVCDGFGSNPSAQGRYHQDMKASSTRRAWGVGTDAIREC